MAEIRMTLEEYEALRRMITSERESEGAKLADQIKDKPKKRKISAELRPELCRYRMDKPKKRKKTARDRAMKKAIPMANKRYKKKNGQFRAGRSQADVMKLANKLADKMMK